jgi:hypothetical protein
LAMATYWPMQADHKSLPRGATAKAHKTASAVTYHSRESSTHIF